MNKISDVDYFYTQKSVVNWDIPTGAIFNRSRQWIREYFSVSLTIFVK